MKLWITLLLSTLLFGRSIPQGYISPIPLDVLTKPEERVHFGSLLFDDGIATPDSKQKIANELSYIQISNIYFNNYEAVWLEILKRELVKLGITPNKTFAITASSITSKMLWPELDPGAVYTVGVIDLGKTPMTLQLPDNFDYALLLDHFGNEIASLDANGSYLLYGPDEDFVPSTKLLRINDEDKEFQTLQSDTYTNFLFIRMPRDANISAFQSRLHATPLQQNASLSNEFIDISALESIVLLPKSARFFKLLDTVAQDDVLPAPKTKELAAVGIVKNRAFQPDLRKRALLQDAAHTAGIILQNTPALYHLKALSNPKRKDTAVITLIVDDKNTTLSGSNSYLLHMPANIAAQNWSVTLYDTQTTSMLQNPLQLHPYILGSDKELLYNADGSIDLHFAPQTENDALQANTIKTVPGKNFFAIVRFYKPRMDEKGLDLSLQKLESNISKREPDEDISVF